MEFGGDFLKTFLEGSVDRVIYRDYIVNRRFFIYCSLACVRARVCVAEPVKRRGAADSVSYVYSLPTSSSVCLVSSSPPFHCALQDGFGQT